MSSSGRILPAFLRSSKSRLPIVRTVSSLAPTLILQKGRPQTKLIRTDINLLARRFYSSRSTPSDSSTSKMTVAIGALLGLGAGSAYLLNEGSFQVGVAHCAEKDKCIEKKCEDSACLRKHECEEEKIMKANGDLEKALKETKGKAVEYTEAAMKAYCEAIEVVQQYLDNSYCLLEQDELETPAYEEAWCCLYKLAKKRCEKVKDAIQKGQCAWELLCRLRDIVEAGKACRFTACNPLLVTAEESLICAERELLNLKARLDCVSSDHDMVCQFKDVIESFRKELKKDVNNYPEEKKCPIEFVEQEMALMIDESYQKAVRVQKELAQVLVCEGRIPDKQQETMC